ncbi:hypothetical protein BAE44_0007926 [Dichanthelium oligosanthes]|uniref:Ubiquitin-like protease family profile domain-containing protein n=1 Tax=Dichanthelium oligosanthes TaxID=888268 RepID=A0A1E5W0Z3_9POAL|nr:hypothetical protein BAE44_0007926 [Dichanthelium oligosanthes]
MSRHRQGRVQETIYLDSDAEDVLLERYFDFLDSVSAQAFVWTTKRSWAGPMSNRNGLWNGIDKDLWKHIDEDKKSAYAYLDSLWFNMYYRGRNISNVLKWIKAKRIFSRQYVFVPIVCCGHWSLLVLCHFGEENCSDIKKGPRMIVLDSLNTMDPTRLQSAIRKFIVDIYKTEEREESKQFINKIRLEFPKVPQQNGDECGIYVLYFIQCFLQNKKLAEVLENKKLEEDFTQLLDDGWFNPEELENFRKDVHSFQANRDNKIAE